MQTWQLQQAKAKLSEVIQIAAKNGPQTITQRGVETAVVISMEEWKLLQTRPNNQTMLEILQSGSRFELPLPERHKIKLRKAIKF